MTATKYNSKRLSRRFRKCDQAIKLPRKLKKGLKKQQMSPFWPTKDVRIMSYGWVYEPDEFGGDYSKQVGFDYPKLYPAKGPRVQRLSEREAEWNKWTGRIGRYKYPYITSFGFTPRNYYGTPRGRMLSLRVRRKVSIGLAAE